MGVPGTHLYQCTGWCCCERLQSASVTFFWRLFQPICPLHDGWFMSTPARTALSVQSFLTKNGMTPVSYPPSSPPLPWATFCLFVSLDENSLQREMFCHYKGANMMFKMLLVDRLIFCYPDSETLPWDKTCCEDDSNHSCPAARGRVQSAHQCLLLLLWGRDSAGPQ